MRPACGNAFGVAAQEQTFHFGAFLGVVFRCSVSGHLPSKP